ncbi:hypothetical protein KVR01_004098 [Diaporthe batatas]|uniref:uncharacterized protein n=1 Tax=Diaporthe batatas TaxID=748121 RepID=UPI001D049500|nr:uncharacterized protein KVR01_004098 [Diaporthe batatas]KAG8165546.1 hypothetical protein KVR01_004098 [Diaporthe batatas]
MRPSTQLLALVPAVLLVPAHGSPPLVKRQGTAGNLVDDQALQDAVTIEGLLGHAQDLEDIAYATEGRNRVVGSEGHNNTVKYLVEQLEALGGYYDVELDPFQYTLQKGVSNFSVNGATYSSAGLEYSPEISIEGVPLVPVANLGCSAEDFPAEVSGAVALISRGTCTFADKSYFAGQSGAVAAVIYNNLPGLFDSGTLGGENASFVATAAVSQEDGLALVASYSNTTLASDLDIVTVFSTVYSNNVIATTAHTNSSDILFLGAHSDSVAAGPGINDNGSGSSGILEVAIQLAKGGWSTIPAVRFGWWTAEEEGLLGAESYVTKTSAAELSRIRLYLNFDMIASPNFKLGIYDGDGSEFGLSGPAGSDLTEALFEDWFDSIGQNHSASEFNGRSDYGPFLDVGIPSGGLDTGADDIKTEEDVEKFGGVVGAQADPNYHSAADNVTNLSLEAFEIMGKGIAHAVAFYGANGFAGYPERNSTASLKSRGSVESKPRQTDLHPRRLPPGLFGPNVLVQKIPTGNPRIFRFGRWGAQPHSLLLYRSNGQALLPANHRHTLVDKPGTKTKPMLSWVQIVATPTADTPGACVLLHFDNRRYIFGHICEGTQRIMNQRKIGVSKLDELFITGPVSWGNAGGLLGMILTIADVIALRAAPEDSKKKMKKKKDQGLSLIPSLKIYAAENITQVLATARRFIFRKGLPLEVHELNHKPAQETPGQRAPDFEDANVRVWSVSVKPEGQPKSQGRKRSHDDMLAQEDGRPSKQNLDENQLEENRKIVQSVVGHMFESDWQLDALVGTTLHKVKLPAKIFVKGPDGKITNYDGPMPGDDGSVPDIPVFTRTPWPATKITQLPPTSPSKQSLSYIVLQQPRRGKFKLQEALRLGVAKPDFSKLTAGETVKGAGGVDVTPEMCIEPTIEGRGFAVIDLPDLSYVEPFLARPEWTTESLVKNVDIMYWMLGPNVAQDQRIRDYMKAHQAVRHNVFAPGISPNYISMEGAAGNSIKSHQIDPDRFPLPVYSNESKAEASEVFVTASPGAKVQLAPRLVFQDEESFPPMDTLSVASDMDKEVQKLADEAKTTLSDTKFLEEIEESEKDIPNRDTEIIPLGTGSALPSKYRNVSATLIRVPGYGSYLFDCGENTLGQLRRMYGYDGADEILRDLKAIWISHLHADHHLGTASFIKAWNEATSGTRIAVASHVNMLDWLREYAYIEDFGFDRLCLVEIKGRPKAESKQEPWICTPGITREFGITRIDAARVEHCHGALACVFTWPSGLRIAYSGDCRPSSVFAEIARDCTLLIHESTLDDELVDDALSKKHCTMSEALGVAKDMRARRVLLTHFSQRYPKIANTSGGGEGAPVKDQVVLLAFDQMCVKLGDFKKAALFLPALRKLYEEDGDDEPPKLD